MSVYQEKFRSAQAVEYGMHVDCNKNASARLPPQKETKTTIPYYPVQDGDCYSNRTSRNTSENEVHFVTN